MLLANTSHELRTPLSRIRLGIELLKDSADPARKAALEKDIAELDGLIEQILLSSRLDATKAVEATEEIDLLALAAEEAARYEQCSVAGVPVVVTRRSRPAAADGPQPARQCRAARRAADRGRCAASGGRAVAQRRRSWRRSRDTAIGSTSSRPSTGRKGAVVLELDWALPWSDRSQGSTVARRNGPKSGRGGRHLGVAPSFGSAAHLSSAARYACPLSLLPFSSPRPKREERRRFSGNGRASSGRPQC